MSLPTRWIICTKWVVPSFNKEKFTAITGRTYESYTEEELKTVEIPTEQLTDHKQYWTPIGTRAVLMRKKSISGKPFSYSSKEEAIAGLNKIIEDDPAVAASKLRFCLCEVKYEPDKIKALDEEWFAKRAVSEVALEIKQNKEIEIIQ
jgi:hypothetical protein